MTTSVLLAGGTGLVGGLVSERLARRGDVRLESLVRAQRRSGERAIDFEAMVADPSAIGGDEPVDVAISCLGTTLRSAGSPAKFRRVDHDYVAAFARAAKSRGATRFVLVSSVGAGGRGLYLNVKGDVERAIGALGFERLDIVRPSLILGPRPERRPAEALAQAVAPWLAPILLGPLARYAALDAALVARAIERLALGCAAGVHIHHVPELRALAAG